MIVMAFIDKLVSALFLFWWLSVGVRIIWAQRSEFREISTNPDARSWPGALFQCLLILLCAPGVATEEYLKDNGV